MNSYLLAFADGLERYLKVDPEIVQMRISVEFAKEFIREIRNMADAKSFGYEVLLESCSSLDQQRELVEEHARRMFGDVLVDAGAVSINPPMIPGSGMFNVWGVKLKVIMPSITNEKMYENAKAVALDDYDQKKHSGLMEEDP